MSNVLSELATIHVTYAFVNLDFSRLSEKGYSLKCQFADCEKRVFDCLMKSNGSSEALCYTYRLVSILAASRSKKLKLQAIAGLINVLVQQKQGTGTVKALNNASRLLAIVLVS